MSSPFASILPFLSALQRPQGMASPQDQDDEDGNPTSNGPGNNRSSGDPGAAQGGNAPQNSSPGRPPRLYAVVYTEGNRTEGGDQDFKNAAFTRADDIRHSPGFDPDKDNVWVYSVQSKNDFKNVVENLSNYEKQFGKVENLSLFSHGGRNDGPIFHKQDPHDGWTLDQFSHDEWRRLNINFSNTATADLMMCHTAEPQNGYAQDFADAYGVPTRGFGDTVFSSDPVKKVRGYGQGGPEYLLGSGGNWFQRNILGYPPQPPKIFLPHGKGGGGGW